MQTTQPSSSIAVAEARLTERRAVADRTATAAQTLETAERAKADAAAGVAQAERELELAKLTEEQRHERARQENERQALVEEYRALEARLTGDPSKHVAEEIAELHDLEVAIDGAKRRIVARYHDLARSRDRARAIGAQLGIDPRTTRELGCFELADLQRSIDRQLEKRREAEGRGLPSTWPR